MKSAAKLPKLPHTWICAPLCEPTHALLQLHMKYVRKADKNYKCSLLHNLGVKPCRKSTVCKKDPLEGPPNKIKRCQSLAIKPAI